MSFIWWEKTVEYAFILAQQETFDFAAPLSGAHEGADGIFASGAKLLLVEFKRDETVLSSEEGKYENFEDAKSSMIGRDGHHLLVYGEKPKESNGKAKLGLVAKTYFAGDDVEAIDFDGRGVEKPEFDAYLADLLLFKKKDSRSSGRLGVEAFASVIGLTPNGEVVSASLGEYMEQTMSHELRNQLSPPSETYEPPSFGM
ncbi:hypothetical protein [Paraburkholderia fungorum]|jgi:hypothetical protein